MVTRKDYTYALLEAMSAPRSTANLLAIVAWMQAEGSKARFNPLATTMAAPGATNFNSTGVKNYPSLSSGIEATVKTLAQERFVPLWTAIQSGRSGTGILKAVADSAWGTGDLALEVYRSILAKYSEAASFPIQTA
jgi:hypothetical protein